MGFLAHIFMITVEQARLKNIQSIDIVNNNDDVEACSFCAGWWKKGELPKHDPMCPKLKDKNGHS
jgi:hypothetical protein